MWFGSIGLQTGVPVIVGKTAAKGPLALETRPPVPRGSNLLHADSYFLSCAASSNSLSPDPTGTVR